MDGAFSCEGSLHDMYTLQHLLQRLGKAVLDPLPIGVADDLVNQGHHPWNGYWGKVSFVLGLYVSTYHSPA